jgi:hypothetical protein
MDAMAAAADANRPLRNFDFETKRSAGPAQHGNSHGIC